MSSETPPPQFDQLRRRFHQGSAEEKIDILLDLAQFGNSGFEVIAEALDSSSRKVRQSAFALLLEGDQSIFRRTLWHYLPFQDLHCLHTLTDRSLSEIKQARYTYLIGFEIADFNDRLVCYRDLDNDQAFIQTWDLHTGEWVASTLMFSHEFGLGRRGKEIAISFQGEFGLLDRDVLRYLDRSQQMVKDSTIPSPFMFSLCPTDHPLFAVGQSGGEEVIEIRNYLTNEISLWANLRGLKLRSEHLRRLELDYQSASLRQSKRPEWSWIWSRPPLLFTPDGESLVVHCIQRVNASHQSLIKIFHIDSGEILHTTDTFPPINIPRLDPTGHSNHQILNHNTFTSLTLTGVAIRPTGELVICGIRAGQSMVWELISDRILFSSPELTPCMISSDARVLLYATVDHQIVIWDLAEGRALSTLSGHSAPIDAITMSFDREFIASHSIDGTIKIWGIPRYRIR